MKQKKLKSLSMEYQNLHERKEEREKQKQFLQEEKKNLQNLPFFLGSTFLDAALFLQKENEKLDEKIHRLSMEIEEKKERFLTEDLLCYQKQKEEEEKKKESQMFLLKYLQTLDREELRIYQEEQREKKLEKKLKNRHF